MLALSEDSVLRCRSVPRQADQRPGARGTRPSLSCLAAGSDLVAPVPHVARLVARLVAGLVTRLETGLVTARAGGPVQAGLVLGRAVVHVGVEPVGLAQVVLLLGPGH